MKEKITQKPNYIELVNRFWKVDLEYSFTANETRLYFFLLHICNSLGWKNPFRHSLSQINGSIGMSNNSIVSARKRLSEAGLIEFHPGKQGNRYALKNKAQYRLPLSKIDNGADSHTDSGADSYIDSGADSINKLNQTKQLFNEFRKAYPNPNGKRSLEVEWAWFTKKFKNYKKIVPLLMPALQAEIKYKEKQKLSTGYAPEWKNFETWLNKECWTQEYQEHETQKTTGNPVPQPATI